MPDDLHRAHKALDKAVDAAYAIDGGKKTWLDDAERVGFLFQRYAALTGLPDVVTLQLQIEVK
jgi:hypothetical protein